MNFGLPSSSMSNTNGVVNPAQLMPTIPMVDDHEADVLNDETFGDCDLEAIKIKSDFGENGEFLGESLPDFFDNDPDDPGGDGFSLEDTSDQSQQPSIDALLGEDLTRMPPTLGFRSSAMNSLFSTAISQANGANSGNPFSQTSMPTQRLSPMNLPNSGVQIGPSVFPQQVPIDFQFLAQLEQLLISRQVPPQERRIYMQAIVEKMQRDAINAQQNTRMGNFNKNGHENQRETNFNRMGTINPQQHEGTRPMVMSELMQRAQLSTMNQNQNQPSREGIGNVQNQGMSSQLMDAIQRSDQIPTAEIRKASSPLSSTENIVSPPSHHHGQQRHNRQPKHYPRPPCLNTWQGRGPGHDDFAGMMNDREKQWVVKIQLHQATLTKDEDFYFQKWCQRKSESQQNNGTQLNRYDHRGQYISYPVLQLLKSIQQEKELADRLSQSSVQATFSNVNPNPILPYAMPLQTQLGKQSVATPRHPRCILHLDGAFTIGTRANAITHSKRDLAILLNIENIYRDFLGLEEEETTTKGKVSIESIVDRYFNDSNYLFGEMFSSSRKGQLLLHRIYSFLSRQTSARNNFELILSRFYGSIAFMAERYPENFQIENVVFQTIRSIQEEINIKSTRLEQIAKDFQQYFNEKVQPKIVEFSKNPPKKAFADPNLFSSTDLTTILIEFLMTLERRCYLLNFSSNSSQIPIQILQQLQNQIQYNLPETLRDLIVDLCESLILCPSAKKIRKPLPQAQNPLLNTLSKFLQSQLTKQIYQAIEPKLISSCVKDP